jgi:hypothetical protein
MTISDVLTGHAIAGKQQVRTLHACDLSSSGSTVICSQVTTGALGSGLAGLHLHFALIKVAVVMQLLNLSCRCCTEHGLFLFVPPFTTTG